MGVFSVMKKYIVFVFSLILLFSLFQVLSGILLTMTYKPDIESAWNLTPHLTQETVIKGISQPSLVMLLIIIFSASLAYYISNKIFNRKRIN